MNGDTASNDFLKTRDFPAQWHLSTKCLGVLRAIPISLSVLLR